MRKALFLLLAVGGLCFWAACSLPAGPEPLPPPQPVQRSSLVPEDSRYSVPACRFRGTSSCSASACHGQNGPRGSFGSEYSTWANYDPHARAYEVLFNDESRQMVANYRRLEKVELARPHQDPLCLKCHSLDEPVHLAGRTAPVKVPADGVGCESCHGASERWKSTHYLNEWSSDGQLPVRQERARKAREGMLPTKDLAFRVAVCANCHIGNGDQQVDHDLIAAGHPRLFFEYSAYHQLLPRHWDEGKNYGRDFLARAWAIGQVASLRMRVELLLDRARRASAPESDAAWPEFAEYSCYSCHHNLDSDWRRGRTSPGRKPGGFLWTPEYGENLLLLLAEGNPFAPRSGAKEIRESLQKLQEAMQQPGSPPQAVVASAERCLPLLAAWAGELQDEADRDSRERPLTDPQLGQLLDHLLTGPQSIESWEWEQAVQHYLGVVAVVQSSAEYPTRPGVRQTLERGRLTLEFTNGYNSPRGYTPKDYLKDLKSFRGLLPAPE